MPVRSGDERPSETDGDQEEKPPHSAEDKGQSGDDGQERTRQPDPALLSDPVDQERENSQNKWSTEQRNEHTITEPRGLIIADNGNHHRKNKSSQSPKQDVETNARNLLVGPTHDVPPAVG